MDNLIISFNVVFPMFVLLAVGYLLFKIGLLGHELAAGINKIIFNLFIPVLIFKNITEADLSAVLNWKLIAYSVAGTTLIFVLAMIIVPRLEKDDRRRGAICVAMFRSNFIIYGMPFATALYGAEASAMLSVMTIVVVPLGSIYSVIALEYFRGTKPSFSGIFMSTIKNPYIIASVLGLCFVLTGWDLPLAIYSPLSSIASVASPLALIVLGSTFEFKNVSRFIKYIAGGSFARLILVPGIFVSGAIALGFRNAELVTLMALFATPPATSSYVMTRQLGGDDELMSQVVVFSTLISIFTIFVWVWVLKSLAFI